MPCSAYPHVVGKVFGAVLWLLQFQLTRLVCGNGLLSRCGGSSRFGGETGKREALKKSFVLLM